MVSFKNQNADFLMVLASCSLRLSVSNWVALRLNELKHRGIENTEEEPGLEWRRNILIKRKDGTNAVLKRQ